MLAALLHEMDLQQNYLKNQTVQSIYLGGGTPSLLNVSEISSLIGKARSVFKVAENIECTLEANPDDISAEKVAELKEAGINRLSIGIQSFHPDDLLFMNRGHDVAQAKKCIQTAIESGITNLSADLIFGFPLLTDAKWKDNIDTLLQYPVQHISCYAMTIEPRTALHAMIAKNKLPAPDDDGAGRQYEYLIHRLMEAGYEHYEISNFARKGYRARHNSSYWKNEPYLGIGPSAHSYNGTERKWNISNNAQYIHKIMQDEIPCETERLTRSEKINEMIMVSLRTSDGLPLPTFWPMLADEEVNNFKQKMNAFIASGMLIIGEDEHLRLTDKGKLFADGIAADFFI